MNDFLEEKRALMRDWIEASENIRDRFGLEKALGYLVGEKFYHMSLSDKPPAHIRALRSGDHPPPRVE